MARVNKTKMVATLIANKAEEIGKEIDLHASNKQYLLAAGLAHYQKGLLDALGFLLSICVEKGESAKTIC